MSIQDWIFYSALVIGALLLAMVLTWYSLRRAPAVGMLDIPNQRSSHSVPTPRGGGIAIVVTVLVAVLVFWCRGRLDYWVAITWLLGGGAVALVGWLDDSRSLSPLVRLIVHLGASIFAVYALDGASSLHAELPACPLWLCFVLLVLTTGWMLNLFNFMDGIDGIAGSEAIFVFGAGILLLGGALPEGERWLACVLVGACVGFLIFNWPPARIFMGDVGSGFLGYVIAIMAMSVARNEPAHLMVWLVLSGVFVMDATLTLLRRLARGEKPYEGHRTHAYQWLSRRWSSHLRVILLVWAVNLMWLLPVTWVLLRWGAVWPALVALISLGVSLLWVGAGRKEEADFI